MKWLRAQWGRLWTRLLLVNLLVVLVPVVGLEFARIYERQLLNALERDMKNQAVLVREWLRQDLARDVPLAEPRHEQLVRSAARQTRTRVRLLDAHGNTVGDSHRYGPPEGREPPAPQMLPVSVPNAAGADTRSYRGLGAQWPEVPDRREVRSALAGDPDSHTRIRGSDPSVLLFHAEPVRYAGTVAGVVYITRSTRPVMVELYRIRRGLTQVLLVALGFTALVSLWLAWSISRPLSKLVRAARQITAGARDVAVPVEGSGEIRELGTAFQSMTKKLDDRLRYISDFAADVTHELKSPLTSIRGAAELLSEGAADDPAARERFLRNIQLDVERLDRLVSRLLELSRIDAAREPLADMDLAAVIRRVIDRSHTQEQPVLWDEATATEGKAGVWLRQWRGRELDIERALLNLVENAVRFSPPGLAVRIELEYDKESLAIVVSDEGPGVPVEQRQRVFDRFFTTDAERSGTGLGLAIVVGVAEGHGGGVTLESPADGGARFVMRLPRPQPFRAPSRFTLRGRGSDEAGS